MNANEEQASELADAIETESVETAALLHMLKVFCILEERDMSGGTEGATLADAADGLAVLLADLKYRVNTIQEKAARLWELWPRAPQPDPVVWRKDGAA